MTTHEQHNYWIDEPINVGIHNFTWREVMSPDCQGVRLSGRFWRHMELLQCLRDWWGAPLTVTSGYRTASYGAEVYMAQDSTLALADALNRAERSQHYLKISSPFYTVYGEPTFATDIVPHLNSPRIENIPDINKQAQSIRFVRIRAKELGFTGIGTYDGFVHLDLRAEPKEW